MMSHIGSRIRQRRKDLRLTQAELGKAIGVGASAVVQWESANPANRTEPKPKHYPKLAQALRTTTEWLVTGRGDPDLDTSPERVLASGRVVDIIGIAGAGHWSETGARMADFPRVVPACPVRNYTTATQYCFALVGDDLRKNYPHADWLYVVSIEETGHRIAEGDVVVMRTTDGHKIENSVWSVVRSASRLALESQSELRKASIPIHLDEIARDPKREITHLAVGFAGHI